MKTHRFVTNIIGLFCCCLLTFACHQAAAEVVTPNDWVLVEEKPDPSLENLTIPADALTKGMWSSVFDWPLNGLHLAILPDYRVMSYGSTLDGGAQVGRHVDIWDPSLGFESGSHQTTHYPNALDTFCTAAVYLNDGTLLISGGNGNLNSGDSGKESSIFNIQNNSLVTDSASMAQKRWYATMLTLPDGRPIILGGMAPYQEEMRNFPDQAIVQGLPSMTPEVYEGGAWRSLFGISETTGGREAFGPDYLRTSYPRAWVAPSGNLFGISAEKMWYLDPNAASGSGAITHVFDFKQPYDPDEPVNVGATNTAVMFAPGKVIQVGGNGGFNGEGFPASDMATVVDITQVNLQDNDTSNDAPTVIEQPKMSHARRYPNAVVLANGQVVVTGGTANGNDGANNTGDSNNPGAFAAEIWNPTSQSWTEGAEAQKLRVYHSITALMPNGTVLSTGGGTPGPVTNLNGEIYYPPYLFEEDAGNVQLAARPKVKAISSLNFAHNDALQMDMESEEAVDALVLIGLSNGTHSFNSGQRRVPLTYVQNENRLTTTVPNANLAPPGYYQVVALNGNGVPSKGVIVAVGQDVVAPPVTTTPYVPPVIDDTITAPIINTGEEASFNFAAQSGYTYSWNFGDGASTPFDAEPAVTHSYSAPGAYVVTLTIKDANGINTTQTFLQAVATSQTALSPTASSPILLEARANATDRVWVVNPDNNSVSVIDTATNAVIQTINVGVSPRNVALAPNGNIWVSNKFSSTISIINPSSFAVQSTVTLPYGSQPHGIAFSPDGSAAYAVLEARGELLALDPVAGTITNTLTVGLNARHIAITADNKALLSRFITPPVAGESTATVNTADAGGEVLVVDLANLSLQKTVLLQHSDKTDAENQGSGLPNYLAAAAISPDGSTAWVPSKQDNIKRGMLRNNQNLDFQNTVRAISSRIALSNFSEDYAKRIDHDNASLSSAAVYHPSGVYLFVALETSREVAVVNAISGNELFRLAVGRAPQGLTISADGNTLYVHEFMDRSVGVFDLSPLTQTGTLSAQQVTAVYTVDNELLAPEVVLGKQLFYDAADDRLARDNYLSCATCHNDGGQDGRVWDFTGFGEGLRNTIALNGRAGMGHGFLHWSANFDEVQDFEKQIRDLAGGTGLMTEAAFNTGTRNQPLGDAKAGVSQDLDDLAAYIDSLSQVALSPYRQNDGSLTASAQLGQTVFETQCMSCHSGTALTNSLDASILQSIGTIKPSSGQRLGGKLDGIDVPTLRDVWATAPYLHDGSAATIASAIQAHQDLSLSATEIQQVTDFVQQVAGQDFSAPQSLGHWRFETGSGTSLIDSSSAGNDLSYNGAWTTGQVGNSAGQFNGSNNASLGGPLVQTDQSYSISAWVKLDSLNGWQTFVGQDAQQVSGFWLQYSQQQGQSFYFSIYETDTLSSPSYRVKSTMQPDVGAWYHLVAVRDKAAGKMRLYVNGVLQGETNESSDLNATGEFVIGRGKWGNPNDYTRGAIDEVQVYNYPITQSQIDALYQTTPANIAPTVSLTAPATATVGTAVTLTAPASDTDGTVSQVSFYQGSTLLGTAATAPYTLAWTPTATDIGVQTLTAQATDNAGDTATSAAVSVTVEEAAIANVPPTVSLTAPVDGATATVDQTVTIAANAADSDGTVAQVAFYQGTVLLGIDTEAPYSITWTPVVADVGAKTLTALATDDDGDISTSAAITVTVDEVTTNLPPTVSLTAPASATVGTAVTLTATASDTDGTVSQVAFYQGATLLGIDTTAPYSIAWTPVAADVGVQTITAQATDDAGDSVTSTAVTITVASDSGTNTDSLLGHWRFETGSGTSLIDSSGASNDLSYNGAWTTGQVGNSAGQFNGSTNASLGGPLVQTDQSYSISAWVKLDSLNGWQTFVGQDAQQVSGFWLQYSQQQGKAFIFSIYEIDTLSSPAYKIISNTKPVVDTWYHLVAVRDKDAGKMRLYINGVLEGELNEASDLSATGEFVIGRGKWGNPNDYTTGAIDEVQVYNYPISPAEVTTLFQSTTP